MSLLKAIQAFQLAEQVFGERMQARGILFDPALGVEAGLLAALPHLERIKADEGALPVDVNRRVGWMLESVDGKGWWDGRAKWDFTLDPNGAVVFPNRSSADFQRLASFHGEVIVTEHVWVTHPPAQAAQFDRARETPRRQQAVEMLLELGWTYDTGRGWEEPAQAAQVETWRPMDSAPRDGTMLRLLVQFEDHATEDTTGPAPTIGACGEGAECWQFAGWCWSHDHFTEGKGTPVGWLPMLGSAPAPEAAHG